MIAVGSKVTGDGLAIKIIDAFLATTFSSKPARDAMIKQINGLIKHANYDDSLFDKEIKLWKAGYYHD